MTELKLAQEHAKEMEQANGQRNALLKKMEDLYWMRWEEEPTVTKQLKNHKITRTPRARNAILGAKRLLIATDPLISVPYDINNMMAKQGSDSIEKFLKACWFASGRVAGNPIHYDAVLSALLYSDTVIGISSTREMLENADTGNRAIQARIKDIVARTPFLFEVYNPTSCYCERDSMGLNSFYRKVKTTAGYVQDHFGKIGEAALRTRANKTIPERRESVTLSDYYDLRYRHLWMDGYEKPIISEEHGLPFIPIAYSIAEGSSLFDKPEEQREPFLYTAWKSGVIDRENMILSVMYTMLFSMGSNPMFVDYLHDPDSPHPVDYSVAGGTIHYRVGERREVMSKQIIDPAMMEGWNIANELEMQSTIYRQALGEPVSSSTPYSSYALMSQSGRLPLLATQRMTGNVIAEALEIALKWIKEEGKETRAQYDKLEATLLPEVIPDIVDVTVQLEIEMPQDRLQMANAANMLAQGDRPLVSRRWVRENVLNSGQSADMTREIWDESTAEIWYQKMLYQEIAAMEKAKQEAMNPQPPPPPPGGALTPEMGAGGGPQPNYGTPPQPNVPPGPLPVEPVPPQPGMIPNQIPYNESEMPPLPMGG